MQLNQLKAGTILSYAVLGVNNIVGLPYTPYDGQKQIRFVYLGRVLVCVDFKQMFL